MLNASLPAAPPALAADAYTSELRAALDAHRAAGRHDYHEGRCWVCDDLSERLRGPCARGCAAYRASDDTDVCGYCIATWPWEVA